ncbi:hypothetical protein AN958_06902 [Leucoagaricus sp. SymC.cos]|nr:hypothetical protein AN958_06902 [Leucoagaricus sp. SymC.cos]
MGEYGTVTKPFRRTSRKHWLKALIDDSEKYTLLEGLVILKPDSSCLLPQNLGGTGLDEGEMISPLR